jgi:hypothetical protein
MSSAGHLLIQIADIEAKAKKFNISVSNLRSSLRNVHEKDLDKAMTAERLLNGHVLQLKESLQEDLNANARDEFGFFKVLKVSDKEGKAGGRKRA